MEYKGIIRFVVSLKRRQLFNIAFTNSVKSSTVGIETLATHAS